MISFSLSDVQKLEAEFGSPLYVFDKTSFIENYHELEEVLKEMGIKNFKLDGPRVLKYELTKEEDSVKIVQDAYENINSWGVTLPKPFQMFQTDPNLNSSATIVNFFFIFDIVGDNYVNP